MSAIRIEEHVAVHQVGVRTLHVDIFQPAKLAGPVPGLLFLPGGGWRTADRAPLKERYGIRLAERGYVCVAGEYRVMEEAPWPAPIQDVKALIRWMRASHARLGLDPAALAIGGKSAGGHLALLAAGSQGVAAFDDASDHAEVSSAVAAVVGIAPVSDLSAWAYQPRMEPLFGAHPTPEVVQAASPITYASTAYPPTLLMHGTADETVPHAMTRRMYEALEQAGVPVDLHLYAGQDHFFDRDPLCSEAVANAIAFFMARYVQVQAATAAD
jgi:acetyl esterase/lipase